MLIKRGAIVTNGMRRWREKPAHAEAAGING